MTDLEDRVLALEKSRFRVVGRINALTTLILDLWLNHLERHTADPVATCEKMRSEWLEQSKAPNTMYLGPDPAQVEIALQESTEALEHLTAHLLKNVRQSAAKRRQTPPG